MFLILVFKFFKMTVTNDTYLPSDEELNVPQEITLSTPWFKAVAPYMARTCEDEIKVFFFWSFKNLNI